VHLRDLTLYFTDGTSETVELAHGEDVRRAVALLDRAHGWRESVELRVVDPATGGQTVYHVDGERLAGTVSNSDV
jgi:hypothetical protein